MNNNLSKSEIPHEELSESKGQDNKSTIKQYQFDNHIQTKNSIDQSNDSDSKDEHYVKNRLMASRLCTQPKSMYSKGPVTSGGLKKCAVARYDTNGK